ncbi:nucleolar zinc-finger protein [Hanseniaspora vineae]
MNNHKRIKLNDMSEEKNPEIFTPVGEAAANATGSTDTCGSDQNNTSSNKSATEVQSLCMQCHSPNGVTKLLLTSIPYFREVVLMSFECPDCGFHNNEIQPASEIQERGSQYIFKISSKEDLNRQVVKSEKATCKFLELEIEIPPQRGQLTTVEGLLQEMLADLEAGQAERLSAGQQEVHDQIAAFAEKVRGTLSSVGQSDSGSTNTLTFVLDDPSGNSWIEYKPDDGKKWLHKEYNRTDEQNVAIGIMTQDQLEQKKLLINAIAPYADQIASTSGSASKEGQVKSQFLSDATDVENFHNEVQTFKGTCPGCGVTECETHMKPVNIPHFKEVIIMSTVCDHCGYKSNEVRTGGEIPAKGKKITLFCDEPVEDLKRDILKSETCSMYIPELHLDIQEGTLGGRFTTLEGILKQINEELYSRVFTTTSDSMDAETKKNWETFFGNLEKALKGEMKFTVTLVDPLAGSYIQNVYAPDEDPNMKYEEYERTQEQNEDLGLNDIEV